MSHSATNRSSCVARIMAAPLFAQSFSNETTSCLLELSSEAVGSSAKITEAFFRIALAIPNRCFSPPERTRALSFSLPCNPTISKASFICPWLFPNFFKETLKFAHENRDYIVVNRNYLHFNPILTSDGRVIDESMLSDDVINVLFPEDKSERIDTYRENVRLVYSSDPNILLYDGQASEIYAYNPNISTGNGLIDQPIIVVVENHHLDGLYITSYISKGAYFIKTQTDSPYTELYPLLKASGIEAYTLELRSVADNYEKVIARQLTMLRIFGTQSVFLLIGLFALIIFTASLYCENYKRKIAACMIEGYSLTNCIRGHLILTIFVYGVSILALWAIEKMNVIGITAESLILPIALLLDIAVTYGLCRRYSTANLYSIMKGAE